MRILFSFVMVLGMLLGAGCQEAPVAAVDEAASRAITPADPALAAIYDRSCRSCHTVAATGAPLTGDVAAWGPRMDKGADVLLQNVINGFGGMPPLGLCMDCNQEQFDALIEFMATGQ